MESYVAPLFNLAYYTFLSAYKLQSCSHDNDKHSPDHKNAKSVSKFHFHWKKPSKARILICILWQVALFLNFCAWIESNLESEIFWEKKGVSIIALISDFSLVILYFSVIGQFWVKREPLLTLLNQSLTTLEPEIVYSKSPERKILLIKSTFAVYPVIVWGFLNNVIGSDDQRNIWEQIFLHWDEIPQWLKATGRFVIDWFARDDGTSLEVVSRFSFGDAILIPIGILYSGVDLTNTYFWVTGTLSIAVWSHHFTKLLEGILESQKSLREKTKQFLQLSCIIEKFNRHMDYLTFMAILSETMYASGLSAKLLSGKGISNIEIMVKILSFIPFTLMLGFGSRLHVKVKIAFGESY